MTKATSSLLCYNVLASSPTPQVICDKHIREQRVAVHLESGPGQAKRGMGADTSSVLSALALGLTLVAGEKKRRKEKETELEEKRKGRKGKGKEGKERKEKERKRKEKKEKKSSFWIHYSTFGLSPEVIF